MRQLLTVPDARLRVRSKRIVSIDGFVKSLAAEMLEQLKTLRAAGLAAPQFGELVRLIVLSVNGLEVVLLNPEVVKTRDLHWVTEGCRSIPGKQFRLKRPKVVKLRGLDLNGRERGVKGHDFLAQVLVHEVDHLNGILIDSLGQPMPGITIIN